MLRLVASLSLGLAAVSASGSDKTLLWGDTHLHTNMSTDSYINQNHTADPDTAYRFAKGLPVYNPATGARVQIQTPLDFLVISDHAESFGTMRRANTIGLPRDGLGPVDWIKSWAIEKLFRYAANDPEGMQTILNYAWPDAQDVREAADNPASIRIPGDEAVMHDTWVESTTISDEHNEPGVFTALIGWEWSSIPAGANLHRVVFTNSDAAVAQQYTPFNSSTNSHPEALWRWLEETSQATGADFIAMPHNSNISRGYMFPLEKRLSGEPIDSEWIALRARWEPVVEATQVKGDSETDPAISPNDPFADFESYPHYISPKPIPWNPTGADFVRSGLLRGLVLEKAFGENPYQFGLIGATDSHTGLATAEEPNFWGKFPSDATLATKTTQVSDMKNFGWLISASGLAGVWAEENTRQGLMDAFKRKEVYATTGPRIAVRVFAAESKTTEGDTQQIAADLQARGVPMGGELQSLTVAPSFYIEAAQDPLSGSLDRIQVIKGWLDGEQTHERIYNVAWSGARALSTEGELPAVPDTVDAATATWSNEHGAPTLTTLWTDPDFDPDQRAFYYVRVLEVPTPRHSTYDAIAMDIPASQTGYPVSIQERAYTSPIHYRP